MRRRVEGLGLGMVGMELVGVGMGVLRVRERALGRQEGVGMGVVG